MTTSGSQFVSGSGSDWPDGPLLTGVKALVTGAARGVGATISRRIVELGGTVVLADINEDGVRATADALAESAESAERAGPGVAASACVLDVADADSWDAAVAGAITAMGGLTALVNNAAILDLGPLETTDPTLIEKLLSVNLLGPTLGVRAVTPALRDNGGGSIVNIASVAGLEGRNATVAYTASKWGVRGMTKASAMELGRYGIRVNAVCPSMGNPDMFVPFLDRFDYDEFARTSAEPALIIDGKPRDADMSDVAVMVTWLLSSVAQVCTGADFVVDAGWTAGLHVAGMPGWQVEHDWRSRTGTALQSVL